MQNIRSQSRTQISPRVRAARRRAAVLAVSVLTVGAIGVPRLFASSSELKIHVVKDGETLWALARSYASSEDPRSYVHEVRELNDLMSAQVFPGQTLILPQ
jgi:LysM domain-containing protein